MHNTRHRRHHPETLKRIGTPAQKLVALPIALKLDLSISPQRIRICKTIDLHRMIHNQIHRNQRLNPIWITTHTPHCRTQRRQIHQRRHTRKILQHHPRGLKRYLYGIGISRIPIRQRPDIFFTHLIPIQISQRRLEQHAHRKRQTRHRPNTIRFQPIQPKNCEIARHCRKCIPRIQRIMRLTHKIPLLVLFI